MMSSRQRQRLRKTTGAKNRSISNRNQSKPTVVEQKLELALPSNGFQEFVPSDPEALSAPARAAAAEGNWQQALEGWNAVREAFPEHAAGHIGAAEAFKNLGRLEDADAALEKAAAHRPPSPEVLVAWAETALERQDWTEAESRLARLRSLFPERIEGYRAGAVAFSELHKYEEAKALLAQARERFPADPALDAEYVCIPYWRGWTGEAARSFEAALHSDSGGIDSHRMRRLFGSVLDRIGAATELRLGSHLRNRAVQDLYAPRAATHMAPTRDDLHDLAVQEIGPRTPVKLFEFGVAGGYSILRFARLFTHPNSQFIGFDSFEGLPEAWESLGKGHFSRSGLVPATQDKRVSFIKGWFQNTVPDYLSNHPIIERETILVHFDADLYSSSLFLLTFLWDKIDSYFFIMDDFSVDEIVALHHFWRAYPVNIEFLARTIASGPYPAKVFGRIRRTELEVKGSMTASRKRPSELVALAEAAAQRSDWTGAALLYQELRQHFPEDPFGYVFGGAVLLRAGQATEGEALLDEAVRRFPQNIGAVSNWANCATRRADWPEAARRWQKMRTSFPDNPSGYVGESRALMEYGQIENAEILFGEAVAQFPDNSDAALGWAECAMRRRDWPEADGRLQQMRERFPDNPFGHVFGGRAAMEAGRHDQAEELLTEAVRRFPGNPGALSTSAELGMRRGEWIEAARRWEEMRRYLPENVAGYAFGGRALMEAGRDTEADILFGIAAERFPTDPGVFSGWAELAMRRGDWDEAIRRWDEMRARLPEVVEGYLGGLRALHAAGRKDDLDGLVDAADARFPGNPNVLGLATDLAFRFGDRVSALRYANMLRGRFPDEPGGWFHAARALREAGRIEETEALLSEAPERFPDHLPILSIWTSLPRARLDTPEALRRSRWLLERFPEDPSAHTHIARGLLASGELDEAERVLRLARERFPDNIGLEDTQGDLLIRRQDWGEAIRHWQRVRERQPNQVAAHLGAARALRQLDRFDEAAQILQQAAGLFPADPGPAFELARTAEARRDWQESLKRWTDARDRFGGDTAGYLGMARALAALGRDTEAEELLVASTRQFRNEPGPLIEWAQLAHSQKDWAAAASRWTELRSRFPNHNAGYLFGANALGEQGKPEAAEALLAMACELFPGDGGVVAAYAWAAHQRHDWPEAATRWQQVRSNFPDRSDGFIHGAIALFEIGRLSEADALAKEAMERFPWDTRGYLTYADLAWRNHDWFEALSRLRAGQRRFPRERAFIGKIFAARMRVAESASPEGNAGAENELPATENERAMHEVMMSFESLGGTLLGCEFGGVQREFGAEPLGLLRWAEMAPEQLSRALEARFAGVGLPENTELRLGPNGNRNEYFTSDTRFGMRMHTFIFEEEINQDEMFTRACRRLQFLRDKLISDLEEGNKIFLYKTTEKVLSEQELRRLHEQMRRYGENTLLYVRREDASHPNGTVKLLNPGLLVGYIDKFTSGILGESLDSWAQICRNAYGLWSIARSGGAAAPIEDQRAMHDIMMSFESLGGMLLGCEFGGIQREFGAEPLGLLRWAEVAPDQLIQALQAKFAGVGLPENTELHMGPSANRNEYITSDTRFGLHMHTFVYEQEISHDEMFTRACRRMQFLRDKLISDLKEGRKIFVYKTTEMLREQELRRLHELMRGYGDNTLLYVRHEDADHPNGTVESVAPGLLVGYIDKFTSLTQGLAESLESWTQISRNAYSLWSAARSSAVVAPIPAEAPAQPSVPIAASMGYLAQ